MAVAIWVLRDTGPADRVVGIGRPAAGGRHGRPAMADQAIAMRPLSDEAAEGNDTALCDAFSPMLEPPSRTIFARKV